jgi:NCAIR mutase (PurE)-related protein
MMNIRSILDEVANGSISPAEAEKRLATLPYEDIGFAKLDHHRQLSRGLGEVVFGPGKTNAQLVETFNSFEKNGSNVLASRISQEQAEAVINQFTNAAYCPVSRTLTLLLQPPKPIGKVAVCSAGTSDLPVAEEVAKVAEFFGAIVDRHVDIGVAGIHRLFAQLDNIRAANAIAVVAGMEGALGSVLTGLVEVPVIAVPTSVGYGASFGGLSALLTMLNSCAAGIATVNIDNGFGAGYLLAQINRMVEAKNAR